MAVKLRGKGLLGKQTYTHVFPKASAVHYRCRIYSSTTGLFFPLGRTRTESQVSVVNSGEFLRHTSCAIIQNLLLFRKIDLFYLILDNYKKCLGYKFSDLLA